MALWLLPKRGLLRVGAKANVPLCGGKKMNKKCAVGKKKKYRRVSKECRLTRCPVSIWSVFVCLSVKMVYFSCPSVRYCQVARSSVTLAANVSRLGEGGDLTTNVHTKHTLQIYEKLSYEALNRHFCQTAVSGWASLFSVCQQHFLSC